MEEAASLPTLKIYERTAFANIRRKVLKTENDSIFQDSRRKIMADENLVNSFVSSDETTLTVNLKVSKSLNLEEKQAYIAGVDSLIAEYKFSKTHLAGMTNIEMRYTDLIMSEFGVFLTLCVLLIIITLGFIYRSFWGVVLPMSVFLLTAIFLGGMFVLTGRHINALTNSLFSIILIVAVSDVVHIFSKFQFENYAHEKVNLSSVIFNNFLTSVTTFIGFCTFYWTPMEVMEKYGVEAAICVLLAYVISIFFVPAVLFCLKPEQVPKVSEKANWIWQIFYSIIQPINGISLEKSEQTENDFRLNGSQISKKTTPKKVFLALSGLLIFAIFGITQIKDNPTLTSSMPWEHPVQKDIRFLESKNLGSRHFELGIEAKKGKITDLENLRIIEKIQDSLLKTDIICSVFSPVNFFKSAHKARLFNSEKAYRLPEEQSMINLLDRSVPKQSREFFDRIIDSTKRKAVIVGRMKDKGKNDIALFNKNLIDWIAQTTDTSTLAFQPTGTALLVDKINDVQIKATLQGLAVAIAVIALIMALLFRNIKYVLITLIINLIPLILMAGVMGYGGFEMRAGTSIVFTIAFVIAVDDTIHFLSGYNFRLRSGMTSEEAIFETIRQTGKALFFTSAVIFLSFGVLLFSVFGDISALGFLIGSAVIFALTADLTILPLLIKIIDSKSSTTNPSIPANLGSKPKK